MVQATNGDLYGATYGSRTSPDDLGTIFKMSLGGKLTTLHTFNGPDGANPGGGIVQASNGNFYGTTTQGGSTNPCPSNLFAGCGIIFQLTQSGKLTTLHSFRGSDGARPGEGGSLIEGADGSLYGTAADGGSGGPSNQCARGCGTVFKISSTGKFTKLYDFCSQTNCSDGAEPAESLVLATVGVEKLWVSGAPLLLTA
ncbi:MAG TPA: choice-of-anchor tandem repeat GloVer-containing protein [Candidatus Sulfotelmatobacter sp.]|nr:choice-of-anchor tandem repeat GloVer-containing protein [Candidatus Sulfotelmatobacter sp.]